jgi:hypothetical protein
MSADIMVYKFKSFGGARIIKFVRIIRPFRSLKFFESISLMIKNAESWVWSISFCSNTFYPIFIHNILFYLNKVRYIKREFAIRTYPETAAELFERESTFRNLVKESFINAVIPLRAEPV